MPKRRVHKTGTSLSSKFRIGHAKSGVAGHGLSTAVLLEVLEDSNKKKYRTNARSVLNARGVEIA